MGKLKRELKDLLTPLMTSDAQLDSTTFVVMRWWKERYRSIQTNMQQHFDIIADEHRQLQSRYSTLLFERNDLYDRNAVLEKNLALLQLKLNEYVVDSKGNGS